MLRIRIWTALAVMALVHIGSSELLNALGVELPGQTTTQSVLVSFAAAFAGGAYAQRHFVLPALSMWAALWVAIVYMLHVMAGPNGESCLLQTLQLNLVAIILSAFATIAGASLGRMSSSSRPTHMAAA